MSSYEELLQEQAKYEEQIDKLRCKIKQIKARMTENTEYHKECFDQLTNNNCAGFRIIFKDMTYIKEQICDFKYYDCTGDDGYRPSETRQYVVRLKNKHTIVIDLHLHQYHEVFDYSVSIRCGGQEHFSASDNDASDINCQDCALIVSQESVNAWMAYMENGIAMCSVVMVPDQFLMDEPID